MCSEVNAASYEIFCALHHQLLGIEFAWDDEIRLAWLNLNESGSPPWSNHNGGGYTLPLPRLYSALLSYPVYLGSYRIPFFTWSCNQATVAVPGKIWEVSRTPTKIRHDYLNCRLCCYRGSIVSSEHRVCLESVWYFFSSSKRSAAALAAALYEMLLIC